MERGLVGDVRYSLWNFGVRLTFWNQAHNVAIRIVS